SPRATATAADMSQPSCLLMYLYSQSSRAMLPPGAWVAQARRVCRTCPGTMSRSVADAQTRCCTGEKWCHNPDSLCRKSNISASIYTLETSQYREGCLDVHFVSPAPVERHARESGHPVPLAFVSWMPAFAGMTRGHKRWQCI